jgi:hypothetical protein
MDFLAWIILIKNWIECIQRLVSSWVISIQKEVPIKSVSIFAAINQDFPDCG